MKKPEKIQRSYYEETAAQYDDMHVHEGDAHYKALEFMVCLASKFEVKTFLDVGCGTGRATHYLREQHFQAVGADSSKPLLDRARSRRVAYQTQFICAKGEAIPFKSASFEAVCAFGVLHHVKRPDLVVKEILRVARRAVFLSDSNRFGQGRMPLRFVKLFLWKTRLWGVANFLKTGGKGYTISEGDGLAYSYSVFDSLHLLSTWADDVFLIPTCSDKKTSWFSPLLTSSHILLCAIKA